MFASLFQTPVSTMRTRVDELVRDLPHLAPRETHNVVVEQLMMESEQLVTELEPQLARLIELVPGRRAKLSLLETVPQLCLKFYPLNPRRQWAATEIPTILSAFARLASHSRRLDKFPAIKTQFWLDVLRSRMAHEVTRDVSRSEFMRPQFPEFVVDFGSYGDHAFVFDDALEDALVTFMTTSPSGPASSRASNPSKISMGFVFKACSLRVASLERLERFLDRSFASSTRQYDLRYLEVSKDQLMPPDLEVLARIVRKCVQLYGLEELRLDDTFPRYSGGSRSDWISPKQDSAPVIDMARTIFSIDRLPSLTGRAPDVIPVSTPATARLRQVSISENSLCLEFFATRFSALRYGSSLEEDSTMYHEQSGYGHNYKDYWRWLAFGLFYPRPKRFAKQFRMRDIGRVKHCLLSVEVFIRTVRNPASELIFNGKTEQGTTDVTPTTELMVCVVKAGASVDLFQTGNSKTPTWTDTFATSCELEAIYERADGSVCVVVPGVGLGWIRAESVERIEREPLSEDRREQDGQYAVDLGYCMQWRADNSNVWDWKCLDASRQTMVEHFGRQLCSLTFNQTQYPPNFLSTVLKHCPNLTQLDLYGMKVAGHESDPLLEALSGSLGDRLVSLNLNYAGKLTNGFYDRLFSILGDVDDPPALRELRLAGRDMSVKQIEALRSVLDVNTRLAVVEMPLRTTLFGFGGRGSYETRKKLVELQKSFAAECQGQLLRSALSVEAQTSFLSVVKSQTTSAVHLLDAWMLRQIFSFAADEEQRRVVTWIEEIQPARDP